MHAGGKVAARAVQTAVVGNADITTNDDVALSAYDRTSSNRKDTASVAVGGKLTVHDSTNVFVVIWSTGSSAIGQGADITSNGVVFVRCNDGQNGRPIINGNANITAGGAVQMSNCLLYTSRIAGQVALAVEHYVLAQLAYLSTQQGGGRCV